MVYINSMSDRNERYDSIKDLKPQSKQLNLVVIVLEIGQRFYTKDNHEIRSIKVADRTGSINVCIYDEPGSFIQPGDICRLTRCYTSMYKGSLTVYTGRIGKIQKVGEFCMNFVEQPNMSEPDPNHPLAAINPGNNL